MVRDKKKTKKHKKNASKKPLAKLAKFLRLRSTGVFLISIVFFITALASAFITSYFTTTEHKASENKPQVQYWFVLYRASNLEQLLQGTPGDFEKSRIIRTFKVKTGIPGERPTPLPRLAGREYWVINKKFPTSDNPETAPYFLQFDVPGIEAPPYGPVPYEECNGQCNWELEGPFGMHGVNGDLSRLSSENPGSSGCVRHSDEDITYLYNLINPEDNVRYYIKDI